MHVITNEQVTTLERVASRLEATGLSEESRLIRDVLSSVQAHDAEYSAAEAAEILGVTPQTIRNWVRGGIIPGRQDLTRHFFVPKQALEGALALLSALPEHPLEISDAEVDAEIEAVRAERRTRSTQR